MAEQNEDFVSFEKALRDLKMQSEELKKKVSEGEIRAFRDGQSMKFKREDIESLASADEDELVFADALEDDAGMVTEELTEEETLLAEDDLLEDEPATPVRRASTSGARRSSRVEIDAPAHEPSWVTAAAILSALLALYGVLIMYSISAEQAPAGLTGIFAK